MPRLSKRQRVLKSRERLLRVIRRLRGNEPILPEPWGQTMIKYYENAQLSLICHQMDMPLETVSPEIQDKMYTAIRMMTIPTEEDLE